MVCSGCTLRRQHMSKAAKLAYRRLKGLISPELPTEDVKHATPNDEAVRRLGLPGAEP